MYIYIKNKIYLYVSIYNMYINTYIFKIDSDSKPRSLKGKDKYICIHRNLFKIFKDAGKIVRKYKV